MCPNDFQVTATRLVRARKSFQSILSSADNWYLQSSSPVFCSLAAVMACCSMWLEYLTVGFDAMNWMMDNTVWKLQLKVTDKEKHQGVTEHYRSEHHMKAGFLQGDIQHEWLQCQYLKLLYLHNSRHIVPPKVNREALQHALKVCSDLMQRHTSPASVT